MSGLRIPGELGITAHSSRGVFKRSLRERSGIEIDFLLGWSQHIPGILVCAGGSIYIPLARRGNGMIGRLGVSGRNPPKGGFPKTTPNLGILMARASAMTLLGGKLTAVICQRKDRVEWFP